MSCKTYIYNKKEYTEDGLLRLLATNKTLVNQFRSQEQRGQDADYAPEDMDTFTEKVKALQETMDVEVVYDDSIPSSRLLGKDDPRTIAAGKPVILINPNALFKTTAIHEFGHVFIDSFPGGLENPRLQKALKELEGTQLEADVKAAYPDLTTEQLQKEILATAIGREGSEIWADKTKANSFETFKSWFFDFLRRTFGMEQSEVTALAQDLLSDKVKDIDMNKMEKIAQEQRALYVKSDPRHPDFGKEESKVPLTKEELEAESIEKKSQRTFDNLVGTLKKVMSNQRQATNATKESSIREMEARKKGENVTRLQSIENLNKKVDLTEVNMAHKKYAMFKYLNWSRKELNKMSERLHERGTGAEDVTDENLRNAYNWYESFTIIEEIQDLTEAMRLEGAISEKELKTMRSIISGMNGKKQEIEKQLLAQSRRFYAQLVAKHDTQTEEGYKEAFKRSWAELNAAGRTEMQEMEYVISKLEEHKDEINDAKLEKANKGAISAISTLSGIGFGILSEKEMSSTDIGVVSQITDKANHNSEIFATEKASAAYDLHNAYKEHERIENSDSRDLRKKYAGMYSFNSAGQGYFASKYDPQFLEDRKEFSVTASDVEEAKEKHADTEVTITKDKGSYSFSYDSKVVDKDGKPVGKKQLQIKGAKGISVDGVADLKPGERPMHVTYTTKAGDSHTITLEEAIARSEFSHWTDVNTVKTEYQSQTGEVYSQEKPADHYLNKDFADMKKNQPEKFAELVRLKKEMRVADKDHKGKESLIRLHDQNTQVEFMRLPGMMKSSISRIAEGQSAKTLAKNAISRLVRTQADDYETQGADFTDYRGGNALGVPVKNRARLPESDQSIDLHTMVLMEQISANQYKERRSVESSIIVISEVMKNKEYQVMGKDGKPRTDAQSKLQRFIKGGEGHNEYKKVISILENKVYGITSKESATLSFGGKDGEKYKIDSQQIVKNGLKYFGTTALVFNYANSVVNTTSGTISNWMEAFGGDVFNMTDYAIASADYMKDLKGITEDMGKNVVTSKTNLTMAFFNSMGPEHVQGAFAAGTKGEVMADMSTLRPLAKAGEHMMQGKATLAILESIKVLNKNGKFINKDGRVVKTKKEAASLREMISYKTVNGKVKMNLSHLVEHTTFTQSGGQSQILFETRNLVRSKIDEMHGQYTSDIQAHAQRYIVGKMAFFLRKWMIPLTLRRWRGITNMFTPAEKEVEGFYNRDQKANIEGYYVSASRFITQIVSDLRYEKFSISTSYNKLDRRQKAGVRKTGFDVTLILLTMAALGALEGGEPDDDILAIYLLSRQKSELTFFTNPMEAMKIASTPTAAVGNLKNIARLIYQLTHDPSGKYISGSKKDQLKVAHMVTKLFPNIKNLDELKDATKFLQGFGM